MPNIVKYSDLRDSQSEVQKSCIALLFHHNSYKEIDPGLAAYGGIIHK
jgi:hypothetical protein